MWAQQQLVFVFSYCSDLLKFNEWVVCLVCPTYARMFAVSVWGQGGHDALHTGQSAWSGPSSSVGVVAGWAYSARVSGIPTVGVLSSDGYLYFGGTVGDVTSLNMSSSGMLVWRTVLPVGTSVTLSPALSPGESLVVVGSANGYVHAVNRWSGVLAWSTSTGVGMSIRTSVTMGTDGTVYVGSTDEFVGFLYSLDGSTGSVRWVYDAADWLVSSPAVNDTSRVVYVGCWDGTLLALDADNGSVLWTLVVGGPVKSAPSLSAVSLGGGSWGTVYVGCDDGYVYAVDSEVGSVVWQSFLGAPVGSMPVVVGDGGMVVFSTATLYKLSLETGAVMWRWKVSPSPAYITEQVISCGQNGMLYFTTADAQATQLYGVDGVSGVTRWKFGMGRGTGSTVVASDGSLIASVARVVTSFVQGSPSPTPSSTFTASASDTNTASSTHSTSGTSSPSMTMTSSGTVTSSASGSASSSSSESASASSSVMFCNSTISSFKRADCSRY